MTPSLRIELLGEFRLLLNGEQIMTVNTARQQGLLTYLSLHRHVPLSRQQIAFTFWPESADAQAFSNLRKLIFQLRQSLPHVDELIVADTHTLGWRKNAPFTLDVAEVEQSLTGLEAASATEMSVESTVADIVANVERVLLLYRGEVLPTCYSDWLLPLRSALHQRVVNTLTQSLTRLEAEHEYQVGLRVAAHLLRLDPLNEAAYRQLMQMRALTGDRAGALRLYHECVTLLEQELGVSPTFETQALYQHLLKSEPQSASGPIHTSMPRHEHVPLVGRKQEWQALQQAWRDMGQRGAHLLTIWGEAGVGKSRLLEELLRWAKLRPGTVAYTRAYAAEGALSYTPLTEWLHSEALQPVLAQTEPVWLSELARLLPELLVANPTLSPPTRMTEGWQRLRFHEALAHSILATPEPRLLLLDDLQWCDAETLAWLRYLMRYDPQASLLVVGTVRSEAMDEGHPLHGVVQQLQRAGQYTAMELLPLDVEETTLLANHLSNEEVGEVALQLYRETEGNPLFVVEMVRAGAIAKLRSTEVDQIGVLPPTVKAVIAERINQLSAQTRQLIQLAATIGRAFTFDVMAAASTVSEELLVQALDELWQRRIVRERGQGYDFSHDKIREVAYAMMSPMRRRLLHRQVANALEQLYAAQIGEVAGLLAAHYTVAQEPGKALTYLIQAGDQAKRLAAKHEALHYYQQALSLAQEESERHHILAQRATIYVELYQGKQAVEDFRWLLEYARQKENRQQEVEALLGLLNAYYVVALDDQELDAALRARELYFAAQQLARSIQDKRALVRSLLLPIWHLWPELIEQSVAAAHEAFAISSDLGDEELVVESKIALIHSTSEPEQAEIGATLLVELQERHDLDRLNLAYNYLMWIHYHLGNFRQMLSMCDAGIEVAAKLGVLPVVYPTLKAFALLGLGEYGQAWASLQQEIADEEHIFGRAFKTTGIGMYLLEVGAYQQAADLLEAQIMILAKQLQRGWLCEWARIHFVKALLAGGACSTSEFARAKICLAAADRRLLQGLKPWRVQMMTVEAEIALIEGEHEKALELLREVCSLTTTSKYRTYLLAAWEVEARILLQMQQYTNALERLDRALQLADEIECLPLAWRLYVTKAQLLVRLGQAEAAQIAWTSAMKIIQRLVATIQDSELQQGFILMPQVATTLAEVKTNQRHTG